MLKIKKKDKVIILTGKHKQQTGIVSRIIKKIINKKKRNVVILEGLNLVKKHTKANPNKEKTGGIITKEAAIDISNVMTINPNNGKKEKIKFKIINNRKNRFFKSNNEVLNWVK